MSTKGWGGRKSQALKALAAAEYGLTCWLCHEPIDPNTTGKRRLSVDHVIPRSRGGDNSLENLRPAHLNCNSSRGNRQPHPPTPTTDNRQWFNPKD